MAHITRRLLLILLAAGVVAGGLYLFSLTAMAQSLVPERGGRPPAGELAERERETVLESERSRPEDYDDDEREEHDEREGHDERGDHDEEASFIEALPGIVGKGVLVALVVAGVVFIPKGINAVVQPTSREKPGADA